MIDEQPTMQAAATTRHLRCARCGQYKPVLTNISRDLYGDEPLAEVLPNVSICLDCQRELTQHSRQTWLITILILFTFICIAATIGLSVYLHNARSIFCDSTHCVTNQPTTEQRLCNAFGDCITRGPEQ